MMQNLIKQLLETNNLFYEFVFGRLLSMFIIFQALRFQQDKGLGNTIRQKALKKSVFLFCVLNITISCK